MKFRHITGYIAWQWKKTSTFSKVMLSCAACQFSSIFMVQPWRLMFSVLGLLILTTAFVFDLIIPGIRNSFKEYMEERHSLLDKIKYSDSDKR